MKRSYDLVAPMYDTLARLFTGNSIHKSQLYFLTRIPAGSTILIAGGGTGWILEAITKIYPQSLIIDYVDISKEMIRLARLKNTGYNNVAFFQQSITEFSTTRKYDVIITPFFLDNFAQNTLQNIFDILHQTLKPDGLWLYTDFKITKNDSRIKKAFLSLAYLFFRIACNIEARKLPDAISVFKTYQYDLLESQIFLKGFIVTSVYKVQYKQ